MLFKRTRYIFSIFFLLFFSCSYISSKIIKFKDLPAPNGNYGIGTKIYTWIDNSREEKFTENLFDKRKIVVQVWYPLNRQINEKYQYLDNPKKRIRPIANQFELVGASPMIISYLMSDIKEVKTNAELNAEIKSDILSKYPLIIFSHGLGGMRNQNSIQIEELVSNGYIVIAPDHSYDANITIFDNNEVAHFKSSEYDENIEYSIEDFYSYRIPQIKTRSSDISFIINKISTLQSTGEKIWEMIDLDKIGIFGHSFGGGTGFVSIHSDDRLDACVALDGWIEPVPEEIIDSGINKPFLYIGRTAWKDTLNYYKLDKLIRNSNSKGSKILLPGTNHFDYSDTPYFNAMTKTIHISGNMPTGLIIDTLNYHLNSFFNMHLKNR